MTVEEDTLILRKCDAVSKQGTVCGREENHSGCHEAFIDGDSRRWWGDDRWAPWEWIVYEFETLRDG